MDPLNVLAKFEIRTFSHSWNNRGYPKIWAVSGYAHTPFSPKFLMGFCSDGPSECTSQIWNPYSFSRSWDNKGYPKIGQSWIRPRSLFSKIPPCSPGRRWIAFGLRRAKVFGWILLLFWPNLKFVALPVHEIIAIGILGGVRTPILGQGRP